MSTIAVNTITDASGGNTASINGATPTTDNTMGRNRIINGDMRIDQRNAGAEVTVTTTNLYTLDRWAQTSPSPSKFKYQQNAGSVTPPVGFTNYLGLTSLSAYSVGAGENFGVRQFVEGFNISDLGWGTANAKTVTLSFWVRSSLTGTFGASVRNYPVTESYPIAYTISAANTWEYKTVTIPGATTGTWATDNSTGLQITFSIGTGSTSSGTAGSWQSGNFSSATGAVSVIGTSGATFYITGVQLEAGSVATSFERRPYGQELALCQRYYQTYPGVGQGTKVLWSSYGATYNYVIWSFKTSMRISPTVAGETLGTVEAPSPEAVTAYSAGNNYAAFGYNGSTYGQATALAEL